LSHRDWLLLGKLGGDADRLLMAGQRPSDSAAATSVVRLHLSLLGDFQRVVDLNSKVSDSAFELGVAEQQLNRPEILGSPVD
jgi:hypothetical protein